MTSAEAAADIGAWLRDLGLERYEQAFRENAIDLEVLPELSEADLEALGVLLGHRKRILKAVAAGRQPPSAAPPAEPGSERRQVSVLFADLVGYTALSRSLDAEELHALLDAFLAHADRQIEAHGGTVDKHIGDCAMGVFGAPVAYGNDAERAAAAALAIRDGMAALSEALGRPLAVHIGLASGQVVASGTGGPGHRTYTVTGESVNLASRLADEAAPGEVLVSEAVQRELAERLEGEEVEPLAVHGFPEPVRAWRLRGLSRRSPSRRPLVGRAGELRQLEAALEACLATGRGQTLYLRGEAGIGKTRMVEELQRLAARRGFACHTALVLDFGGGTARDAIRTLVRSLLDLAAPDSDKAARAVTGAVADGLVEPDDVVHLNDLLDLPQPPALRGLYDSMDSATRSRGGARTVARLVERSSRRQPLLLAVEDLHWADRATLDRLADLSALAGECRALLVMTSRLEGDPIDAGWRARAEGAPLTTIDLGPFRKEDAHALAGQFIAVDRAFAERCIERAAGNPLFLEQLLSHAEQAAAGEVVPASVQSLVQARLDRLPLEDRRALQAASVLGQRFVLDALRHLLDRADYRMDRLIDSHLVRPSGEDFLFAHALIREGVYDSLLRGARRPLHRRAAAWYRQRDETLWAEHLERAEDPGAAAAYLAAARRQAAEYRYELALRLVERGLALGPPPAERFALACFRGQILHDLGAMAAAQEAYEAALGAAASDAERCRAWIGLAGVKRVVDDLPGAFADLAQAEAAAAGHGLTAELAQIHFLRGNLCFPAGDFEGCRREHEKALAFARAAGLAEMEAAALGGLGDAAYARGSMISAHAHLERCVALCRRHGLGRIEVANLAQIAHTMLYFRPQQEGLQAGLAAAEAAARVGHARAEINACSAVVFALCALGEFERCRAEAERLLALVRRLGARRFEQSCFLYLGRTACFEGRRAEAARILQEGVAVCRDTGMAFQGPQILATLALALEDPAARRAALAEAEAILRRGSVGHNDLRFYPDAMEVALALEDYAEARRYADALEAYTRDEPLPWSSFFVARGRALAALAEGGADPALLEDIACLHAEGGRLGLRIALPALASALG